MRSDEKLIGRNDFSFQFRKILIHFKRIGSNLNLMRQSLCLVITQSRLIAMLPSYTCSFMPVGRASDSVMHSTESYSI